MSDTSATHRRLTKYLLVKSAAELLFVCALLVGFYVTTIRAPFRARLDAADARVISGSILDPTRPATRPELQLFIDGRHAETLPPASVTTADGAQPFSFRLPPLRPGPHEARVYAVRADGPAHRRIHRLIGNPVRFTLDAQTVP